MKAIVLSFGFFLLVVSPSTCSYEENEMVGSSYYKTSGEDDDSQNEKDIDPVVVPKKPQ